MTSDKTWKVGDRVGLGIDVVQMSCHSSDVLGKGGCGVGAEMRKGVSSDSRSYPLFLLSPPVACGVHECGEGRKRDNETSSRTRSKLFANTP